MGINIGSTSRAIVSLASTGAARLNRAVASTPPTEKPGQLVKREEAPEIRAGFGENTLSVSGAALKTIDSNLKAAKQLVPTSEELRERARVAQARREEAIASAVAPTLAPAPAPEATANNTTPVELPQRELVRPEANPAVRNFVQDEAGPSESTEAQGPAAERRESARVSTPPATPSGTRLNLQA